MGGVVSVLRKESRSVAPYTRKSGKAVAAHQRTVQVGGGPLSRGGKPPTPPTEPPDGMPWLTDPRIENLDAAAMDVRSRVFAADTVEGSCFDGALLDGARFGHPGAGRGPWNGGSTLIRRTTFRGASLRGVTFENCEFEDVSFEKAVLVDINFVNCAVRHSGSVDLHGAVLHSDAFDDFLATTSLYSPAQFLYRRYAPPEVCERLGIDDAEFAVQAWVGDLDVRDNDSLRRVSGGYDRDAHHIPEWHVNALLYDAANLG